ncbi:TetR/AcrR family transcriptional regulator [Parapedomonas caeni]
MTQKARNGPGRPVDLAKREAILVAARRLMLQYGAGVTLDAVAQEAGVSRQTIYNAWPNKEQLLAAVMNRAVDEIMRPLAEASAADSVELTLTRVAEKYFQTIITADGLKLLRLMLTGRSGEASSFYANGPGRSQVRLADYLAMQAARGLLAIHDPGMAAEHFFGMLKGNHHLRSLISGQAELDAAGQQRWITATVAAFLRAYDPGAASAPDQATAP